MNSTLNLLKFLHSTSHNSKTYKSWLLFTNVFSINIFKAFSNSNVMFRKYYSHTKLKIDNIFLHFSTAKIPKETKAITFFNPRQTQILICLPCCRFSGSRSQVRCSGWGWYRRCEQISWLGGEVTQVKFVSAESRWGWDLVVDGHGLIDLDHHGVVHSDDANEVAVAVGQVHRVHLKHC